MGFVNDGEGVNETFAMNGRAGLHRSSGKQQRGTAQAHAVVRCIKATWRGAKTQIRVGGPRAGSGAAVADAIRADAMLCIT